LGAESVTVTDPVWLAGVVVVGEKLTYIKQLEFAAIVPVVQLVLAENAPEVARLKLADWLWLLVSVTCLAALELLTSCAGKLKPVLLKTSGLTALPCRFTTCGLVAAESVTCSWPLSVPPTVGAKLMVTLHELVPASVYGAAAPQVVDVCSKLPERWKLMLVSEVDVLFVIVTV
jgi:hypothetical protein